MPRVLDIQRRYMELGRIRMGEKGAKGQPTRLETWRLTSASKDLLDSAAAIYGGTVEEWTDAPDKGYYELTTETPVLDVMVPPGDSYSQFYELWSGGGCKRRCNGQRELLSDSPCKCDPEERECKITTRINVLLPRVAGLGVWRLESHGYYAAAELPDMLDLLQQVSGGRLVAGHLRIEQRSSKKDGQTKRFPVPVLDLPNVTLASLTDGQVVVNPPLLEGGKPALLTGTQLPDDAKFENSEGVGFGERPALPEQAEPGERGAASHSEAAGVHRPATTPASPQNKREQLAALMAEKQIGLDAVEEYATLLGFPKGRRLDDEQMDRLIEAVKGHGTDQPLVIEQAADSLPAADPSEASPPASESVEDGAATSAAAAPPPKPGTDEYKALPATEKAQARAYWSKQDAESRQPAPMNPEQETLQMGDAA